MKSTSEKLSSSLGSIPGVLLEFYEVRKSIKIPDLQINILTIDEALKATESMKGIGVVDRMGLWVLDDANNSNPFCYITKGPCAGGVIYFSHDPEPEIYFSTFEKFLTEIDIAKEEQKEIEEIEKEIDLSFPVDTELEDLCEEDSDDAVFLICTYLPVAASLPDSTKVRLISHEDFFVRESFAIWLGNRGEQLDLEYAEKLASDKVGQVQGPAKSAVQRLRKRS